MFKPCVIIPVYNHPQKIAEVIAGVIGNNLECLVIDDGSSEPCKSILKALDDEHPAMHLTRMDSNQGKGVAVGLGLKLAQESGYTHALQVDADAQHDLNDIPKFIEQARSHPDAVISGSRVYDDNAPSSRRYGRLITDFWVWVNTLSLDIRDSMCGYRLYPLAATNALLARVNVGPRMQFDTDILVRLHWEGIEIQHIDTRVVYHESPVSHFDMIKDNLRISVMHTRLFFGMLIRSPRLLHRKFSRDK